MSTKLNLEHMRNRAVLLAQTDKVNDKGCRKGNPAKMLDLPDGRHVSLLALGYYCQHKHWPVDITVLVPICGTEDCVVHVDILDPDAQDIQLISQLRPTRTLAQIFREGRRRGWFKGGGGYA